MNKLSQTFVLVFCLLLFSCKEKTNKTPTVDPPEDKTELPKPTSPEPKKPKAIVPPEGYDQMGEAEGDLDKDGVAEKVIVYNTTKETDFGTARQVLIFKQKDGEWAEWQVINGAVLPSDHGGLMGDPFQEVRVERGCIVIDHFGGSRQKWAYIHRFRLQNDAWELIGTTVNFGTPCDSWEEYDYNLSNGKIIYKKETESCDGKEETKTVTETSEFTQKLSPLPKMRAFYPGENEMAIKGSDLIFYY